MGDDPQAVAQNRSALALALNLPAQPCWLEQTHSVDVVQAVQPWQVPAADAVWSDQPGHVCAVMVADCLPILLRDSAGSVIAAVHAGWRGLADGIVTQALQTLRQAHPQAVWQAWLGPCIGPHAFEVGNDVRQAFVDGSSGLAATDKAMFELIAPGRYKGNLQALAKRQLLSLGVEQIWHTPACTVGDPLRFFSYRRDGQTGRMAALIWRDA